ncbi:hypothetical protein RHSIM_Rhsim06G0052300 [Rhododendron simsii]|uniref:Uncharacterized protein n=1 Tax=Rhododendron simsii TaxID=118357 RepID=A0A834H3M7_RHOSS|nr:hypothetical protein RHSIM_Rhsim06G0052300 [Rhododendron simsii]
MNSKMAMYKALWDDDSYSSDIIAAIDQAMIDGVDVPSLSFGSDGLELYENPIAIATFVDMEKDWVMRLLVEYVLYFQVDI